MSSFLYYFKIKFLLTDVQNKRFKIFVLFTIITMLIEVLSISLVVPFITVLSGSQLNFNIKYLDSFNQTQIIFLILSLLVFIITIKVIFISFYNKKIHEFYMDLRVSLSEKIYRTYLMKPYEYHLSKNSSTLIRNIDDVRWFGDSVKYLIYLMTECIMVLGIFSFVLYYEPIGAISSVSFLGLFGYLIYTKVQSQSKKLGSLRRYHDEFRLRYLQQGFHAIKDIKVKNKENSFIQQFSYHDKETSFNQMKYHFIQTLPKLLLEWLLVIGVMVLMIVFFFQKESLTGILPTLGLFLVAAFRLMPSITRIMNSLQSIRWGESVIDSLNEELILEKSKLNKDIKQNQIIFDNSIELKNINFNYKNSSKNILSDINLKIKFGDNVGLLGFSGAGKTTLINLILGLLKSSSGTILADGTDIHSGLINWQSHIGYVPQNIYLTDDTLKKNIAFGIVDEKEIDLKKIDKAIKDAQLTKLVSSLNNGLNTKLGEFGDRISGGERQRIGIARALYNNPKLLILDESTNSLDSETEGKILEDVISLNKDMTIIMIAHRLSTLSKCNRILKLTNSKIEELEVKN